MMQGLISAAGGRPVLYLMHLDAKLTYVHPGHSVGVQIKSSDGAAGPIDKWPAANDGYMPFKVTAMYGNDGLQLELPAEAAEALMYNNLERGALSLMFPNGELDKTSLALNCRLSDFDIRPAKPAAPQFLNTAQAAPQSSQAAAPASAAAAPAAAPAAPAPQKKSKLWLIIALFVLLLAALGAAAYFLTAGGDDKAQIPAAEPPAAAESAPAPEPEPQSAPEPEPAAQTSPCALNNALSDADQLSGCLNSRPADADLLKLAADAVNAERCDLAGRLYLGLGRQKGGDFALQYAQYLDPNSQAQSVCFKKSAADAVYWYNKVLEGEPGHAAASAAVKALQGAQ